MKRLILALLTGAALAASSPAYAAVKTIVLVHGAFADGSGWRPVADILQSHGYSSIMPPFMYGCPSTGACTLVAMVKLL